MKKTTWKLWSTIQCLIKLSGIITDNNSEAEIRADHISTGAQAFSVSRETREAADNLSGRMPRQGILWSSSPGAAPFPPTGVAPRVLPNKPPAYSSPSWSCLPRELNLWWAACLEGTGGFHTTHACSPSCSQCDPMAAFWWLFAPVGVFFGNSPAWRGRLCVVHQLGRITFVMYLPRGCSLAICFQPPESIFCQPKLSISPVCRPIKFG